MIDQYSTLFFLLSCPIFPLSGKSGDFVQSILCFWCFTQNLIGFHTLCCKVEKRKIYRNLTIPSSYTTSYVHCQLDKSRQKSIYLLYYSICKRSSKLIVCILVQYFASEENLLTKQKQFKILWGNLWVAK